MSNPLNVTLYGEQATVFEDWLRCDGKHCIDILHAGSGKTFLAAMFLPIAASDPRYHQGKDIVYSAPTFNMVASLIWEPLKQNCKEHFGIPDEDIHNGNLTIKFPNNVFIRCKSAEQKENLRGMNVGIWVADECSLYSQESLQEITNRLRPRIGSPDSVGRLIAISTPYGAGPLYDLYKVGLANPDKFVCRLFDYLTMRSGNLKFINEQKKILSPLKFAQDYLCKFESVEDAMFYTWRKELYTKKMKDLGGNLYSFHDFNKRVMTACIAQVTKAGKLDGKIEILKSYAIENCSTEGIAQAIRVDFPNRNISSVIDMSGTALQRDTTSAFGITDRVLLEKYGFTIVNSRKSNPLIADTDNTSNAFIKRGGLVVDPDDLKLLDALSTYHFTDGTRKKLVKYTEAKYAHIDGLGDCIRYGIHHLFPIHHDSYFGDDNVSSDPRTTNRPGSQYLAPSPLYPGGPSLEQLLGGEDEADDFQTA